MKRLMLISAIIIAVPLFVGYKIGYSEGSKVNANAVNELKHCRGQVQIANDQVEEWNKNFKATDYANRNGIKHLKKIIE